MTVREISILKKRAKNMQRETGRKHTQILEELAKEQGFQNWNQLVKASELGPAQ